MLASILKESDPDPVLITKDQFNQSSSEEFEN